MPCTLRAKYVNNLAELSSIRLLFLLGPTEQIVCVEKCYGSVKKYMKINLRTHNLIKQLHDGLFSKEEVVNFIVAC